jgi:hypothetical protein
MTFVWVTPASRFDSISFSNEIIDGRSLPPTATYRCPNCDQRVGLTRANVETAPRRVSNFDAEIAGLFDKEAEARGHAGLGFLDWRCPGCSMRVRVYVRTWAGGKHGDAGADLIEIVEAQDAGP